MAMPNCRCPSVSFISLVVLMVQNSLLVVLTRYSRISVPPEKRYHTSTLVLNQEIVKMLVCLVLLALEERSRATVLPHMTCRPLKSGFLVILKNVSICKEALELSVPALLYVLQNFLTFVGLSNLDAATFQVWSQTKLLFTALLSEVMLGRHLSSMQWMALVLLAFGVLLTQRQDAHQHHDTVTADQRPLRGIFACVVSGLSSSYASVYFEKLAKTTAPSLAARNIQLSQFCILFSFLTMVFVDVLPPYLDHKDPKREPFVFWRGYDQWLTIVLVCIHALGGLLVSAVMKYADNILKTFATGGAVALSGVLSFFIWGTSMSLEFITGVALITFSTVLYNKYDKREYHTVGGSATRDCNRN